MQPTIEGFRLSPQQKHLWLAQPPGTGAAYYVAGAALLEAALDVERLAEALAQVVEQHEVLRSTFQLVPGMQLPLQVIGEAQMQIEQPLDLQGRSAADQRAAIAQAVTELAAQPFDLARGPLLRLRPAPLDDARFALLIAFPALSGDPRSLINLAATLVAAYTGAELVSETLQYVDASEWQHELLDADESAAGRAFWNEIDHAAPGAQALPFASLAAPEALSTLRTHDLTLDTMLAGRLRSIAATHDLTLDHWLCTGWAVLLARLIHRDRLVVGLGVDGRPHEDLRDGLGLYARTVPLQIEIDGRQPFVAVASDLHHHAQAAREWQLYFDPERHLGVEGRSRYFPLTFSYTDLRETALPIWSLTACLEPCLLRLECVETDEALAARLVYDPQHLSETDVAGLGRALLRLLSDVADAPTRPVSDLRLDDDPTWQTRLQPDPPAPVPSASVHTLIAAQAARTPDRVAVQYEQRSLSYAELEHLAAQIGRRLRAAGAGIEQVAAVALGRTPEMVAAMLGVLKAGAAYLPIDLLWPHERIRLVLAESRATVLITDRATLEGLPSLDIPLVLLDEPAPDIHEVSLSQPDDPERLAYVLFTSGSTGTPRGVAIEHRQLTNYLSSIQAVLDLPDGSHYGLVSTFAADLGNTVIFPALCSGGTLHIISTERAADAALLASYLRERPIDCLKIVPSHLAALLDGQAAEAVLPRRRLVLGGEGAPWRLIERVRALRPDCAVLNHYGPTETTVGVLTYPVTAAPPSANPIVPLGRPLPHSQVYVLDSALQTLPPWFPGEICIGGGGVARGYLGRPDLTVDRFIPSPFGRRGSDSGSGAGTDSDHSTAQPPAFGPRLYKSGDLGRMLPDGTIEFLGRLDQQIKLHGFRIEPGEIEAALLSHSAVQSAVVMLREDVPGDPRLIAYVAPATEGGEWAETSGALRAHLEQRLPPSCLPSMIIPLAALPLTPNGKLDRRALPTPQQTSATRRAAYVAPHTPTEQHLAAIWTEILRAEQIGVHDNFFELGGHSLMATQVVSRVRERFGVELPLRSLFEARTIAEMAAVIDRQQAARVADNSVEALAQDLAGLSPEEIAVLLAELGPPDQERRDG